MLSKRASKALEDSIKKWKKIIDKKDDDRGKENCPLCDEFWDNHCLRCPVALKVGDFWCGKTPYDNWIKHQFSAHDEVTTPHSIKCSYCKILAKKELEFLKSLRVRK